MKHSALSSLSVLSLLIGTLSLVGCGGSFNMPDSVVSSQGAAPPIVGGVFGGHAPIVGSHVYLLSPSTVNYGGAGTGATLGVATSLLGTGTTTTPGGYPLHTNTATGGDPNIPAGWQYVITDTNGQFNLTDAYTCTAGEPVYVYSYGGNATGGSPTTANNPGIVLLGILGNCPANLTSTTGNFSSGSTALQYLYVNEVSTVSAAYVFQPFTTVGTSAALSSAIYVGTSGTTQAQLGIQNAALTAGQLYDIQGGGTLSTTPVGEGHVANYQTQVESIEIVNGLPVIVTTPNVGNGIVPQATIDTLANILADCVDSNNTATAPATVCTNLFNNTRETGDSAGTAPTDIARAAMNLARYPAGNNSTANTPSNLTTIYSMGQGTVPYTPHLLAQPNDFTIAINYPYLAVAGYTATNDDVEKAESVQVDQNSELWITAQGGGDGSTDQYPSADRWTNLGVPDVKNPRISAGHYMYGYVSVDGGNNAWTGNVDQSTGIFYAGANGSFNTTFGSGYTDAYVVIADKATDLYFFAQYQGNFRMLEYPAGSTTTTTPTVYNISTSITAGNNVAHGAIDASSDLWITSESSHQIARVTNTGTKVFSYTATAQPEFPAIDSNGTGWIALQAEPSTIQKVVPSATTPFYTATSLTNANTGARMAGTFGAAVDGNGNVWFTNRCGETGNGGTACTNNSDPDVGSNSIFVLNGTNNQAISPTTNYIPQTLYSGVRTPANTNLLDDSLNLAIDPSGNVWITNYLGGAVVELVGAAAPVVTPLSVAAANGQLGTKP